MQITNATCQSLRFEFLLSNILTANRQITVLLLKVCKYRATRRAETASRALFYHIRSEISLFSSKSVQYDSF